MPFEVKKIKKNKRAKFSFLHSKKKQSIDIKTIEAKKTPGKPTKKIHWWKRVQIGVAVCCIFGGIWFVTSVTSHLLKSVSGSTLGNIFLALGSDLKKDEYGYTNILLLGSGGLEHESPDLTDTIIVASLQESSGRVTMLSLPRDYYIPETQSRINQVYLKAKARYLNELKKEKNEAKELALGEIKNVVENITDMHIQYIVKTDFKAFREVIDALGGVTVYVEEDINDPYYPDENTFGYDPFKIKAGTHLLDGETALKYVRSRKTTSDFDRSRRQRQVILAIKDAALQRNVLTSPQKIKDLIAVVEENIETTLSVSEIVSFGGVGAKFETEKLVSYGIHDDPLKTGGFLYTPPRDDFGGAFVLIPAKEEWIQTFTKLIFHRPQYFIEKQPVILLNGTKARGLATDIFFYLQRFGLNVIDADNTLQRETFSENVIYYHEGQEESIEIIENLIDEQWKTVKCKPAQPRSTNENNLNTSPVETNEAENESEPTDQDYCDHYDEEVVVVAGTDFDYTKVQMVYQ